MLHAFSPILKRNASEYNQILLPLSLQAMNVFNIYNINI